MANIGNISRRNFFKLALGGAVVAATASPAIASVLAPTYADKLKTLIRLHSEVVEMKEAELHLTDAYNKKFDELVGYICDEFKVPTMGTAEFERAQADVRKVFNWKQMEIESPDWTANPPVICEAAVGISVLRDLLSVRRCRLNPGKMNNFGRFADMFQELILNS